MIGLVGVALFFGAFLTVFVSHLIDAPQGQMQPVSDGGVVGDGAELIVRRILSDGGLATTEVQSVSGDLIGLTLAELRSLRPDWHILSFSPERIVVDVPCETQGSGGFLRGEGGYVAIFAGVVDGCFHLEEVTMIKLDDLSEDVQDALRRGIVFTEKTDLPQILDGLQSTAS